MIVADVASALALRNNVESVLDLSQVRADVADFCRQLVETMTDPGFPGALVPDPGASGTLQVLIAAPTTRAWRQLSPVLRAFAGPSLTSFNGITEPLPETGGPIAAIIAGSGVAATGVIRIPHDARDMLAALRALIRMRETLARAPDLQTSAPEPTSWLLARFQDNLNVGRRGAAADILARLTDELRLDALNIKFLEIQLLAAFSDWNAILGLSGFANLCVARRPPAITALLLHALYQVHLASLFEAGDRDAVRQIYETEVRVFAQPMLAVPTPPTLSAQGWRIYGLENWVSPSRNDIYQAVAGNKARLGWIADQLTPIASKVEMLQSAVAPIDEARNALAQVDAVEAVDNLAAALAVLAKLTPDEIALLRDAEPFGSAMRITDESAPNGVPSSWQEWLDKAVDPSFTNALDIARLGKDEWPSEAARSDPLNVSTLVSALNRAQNNPLASERTSQALPFLVAWLQRDGSFPAHAMKPVYANLLTLFALDSSRAGTVYQSSQILIEALLEVGLTSSEYSALIADIDELAGEGFGVDMIYWILDTIEAFMRASAPDAITRNSFLHSVLARTAPIYNRLSSLQQIAVKQLAAELGWSLSVPMINADTQAADDFSAHIEGLRIAIYSLTETSSRQAKVALEEMVPSLTVDCNSDHGGTARLRALAENADLFVVTWLSAKHAATEFIREHRGNRPLLYAQGRGFSSILRAIEEHLTNAPSTRTPLH
ncbi:protein DpdD [Rhizobium ruizarguesonis]